MKTTIWLTTLALTLSSICFGIAGSDQEDCEKDVKDPRGKMEPWEKGAWETGQYRNVFLDAGYSQSEIDAFKRKLPDYHP